MLDDEATRKPFYPSRMLAYIFALVCAIFVANSSAPFTLSPGGFLGSLLVQSVLVIAIPASIAFGLSGKGKNPAKFGWAFLIGTVVMTALAYLIAHQS